MDLEEPEEATVDVGRSRRHRGWWLLGAGIAAVVAIVVAWPVGGPESPDLAGLDPNTAAFVRHHDAVEARLTERREEVAGRATSEASPEHLMELAAAVGAARDEHAAAHPPTWIADVVDQYQQALVDEQQALEDAYTAVRSDRDARAALLSLLDEQTAAENLQRAIRQTAIAGRPSR